MKELLIALGAGVIAILFMVVTLWNNRRIKRNLERVLRAAVSDCATEFRSDAGGIYAEVVRWAVPLAVSVVMDEQNSSVEIRAFYTLGAGPVFEVLPRHTWSRSEGLGIDEVFDQRFVVETKELDRVRRLWSETARGRMHRLADPTAIDEGMLAAIQGSLKSNGRIITFSRGGGFRREESYRIAMDLVAELAGAEAREMAASGRRT